MQAAAAQDRIGLFVFLLGRLSSHWIGVQASYYSQSGNSRSATLWAKRLCQQLLQFSHNLWLSRNHQVKAIRQTQELTQLDLAIREEFAQGTTSLLPVDHFYVRPIAPGHGFDLQSVLAMDISDKRLWLSALRDARSRGQPSQPSS